MTTKEIGALGEYAACEFLEDCDYEILERNYSMKTGEIDIIAMDESCTVFIEVKTRKNEKYGSPSEYVNYKKQQHIIKTALMYMNNVDDEVRFDVVEVFYSLEDDKFRVDKINHIKDAF